MSFVVAGLVLLLRPYKKTAYNIIDFLTLFFMTLLPFFAIIFLLPFIVLLTYILFRVFKSCCCYACKTQNASQNNETTRHFTTTVALAALISIQEHVDLA